MEVLFFSHATAAGGRLREGKKLPLHSSHIPSLSHNAFLSCGPHPSAHGLSWMEAVPRVLLSSHHPLVVAVQTELPGLAWSHIHTSWRGSWEVVAVLSLGMGCIEYGCHSPLVARARRPERGCRSAHESMGATELSSCVAA